MKLGALEGERNTILYETPTTEAARYSMGIINAGTR